MWYSQKEGDSCEIKENLHNVIWGFVREYWWSNRIIRTKKDTTKEADKIKLKEALRYESVFQHFIIQIIDL